MAMDDPFEYLTFGATFGRTFSLLFDRFDLFMGVSLIVMVPYAITSMIAGSLLGFVALTNEENPNPNMPLVVLTFAVQVILYDVTSVIGQGAITQAVAQIYIGQRPAWLQCIKSAWRRKCSLIGGSLIVFGTLFVALIPVVITLSLALARPNALTTTLCVLSGLGVLVGGVYAYMGSVLTSPSIMVEGFASPMKGVKRSWELSNGSRCYILCTFFGLWFFHQLIARLLNNLFLRGDTIDMLFTPTGIIVVAIPNVFAFPLHGILETVLYLNLRIGRESMNQQVLSGDLMADASNISRFRNDDPGGQTIFEESFDYRHVPLIDTDEDQQKGLSV